MLRQCAPSCATQQQGDDALAMDDFSLFDLDELDDDDMGDMVR